MPRVRKLPAAVVLAAALFACGASAPAPAAAAAPARPNIVFILTDDLSWNLVDPRFMPHVADLRRRGVTFSRYFVSDSLCCPSRATIFTGLFPHDTKVVTNLGPDGGFAKFQSEGLDQRTFAVALQRAGYQTSLLGKYLNGYGDLFMNRSTAPVPPGWTDWHVSNITGYAEFNYVLNDNGTYRRYGGPSGGCGSSADGSTYGVDVSGADALDFIDRAGSRPFMVEVATFAPHAPYIQAPRYACDFPGLTQPRDPSFGAENAAAPAWLGGRRALTDRRVATMDAGFRRRAQAVEAVDKVLADVEAKLQAKGLLRSTYIVFSSDNGYHMGQHRLGAGKQTAFDTDIRVPLIVAGPGVPRGRTIRRVAQNVDLYPTFVRLGGGRPATPVDGRSLVRLLHPGRKRPKWRTVALVEHHHGATGPDDPDLQGRFAGNPPTYAAIRLVNAHLPHFRRPVRGLYVEYTDGATEFYDLRRDPWELANRVGRLSAAQRGELHAVLSRLVRCHGAKACWKAGRPR
jgi:N-acetylglucosamine-6-sulfatase